MRLRRGNREHCYEEQSCAGWTINEVPGGGGKVRSRIWPWHGQAGPKEHRGTEKGMHLAGVEWKREAMQASH